MYKVKRYKRVDHVFYLYNFKATGLPVLATWDGGISSIQGWFMEIIIQLLTRSCKSSDSVVCKLQRQRKNAKGRRADGYKSIINIQSHNVT